MPALPPLGRGQGRHNSEAYGAGWVMTLDEQMDKIRSGAVYNDLTAELVQAREQAVFLANRSNSSFGKPSAVREEVLKELLGRIGN